MTGIDFTAREKFRVNNVSLILSRVFEAYIYAFHFTHFILTTLLRLQRRERCEILLEELTLAFNLYRKPRSGKNCRSKEEKEEIDIIYESNIAITHRQNAYRYYAASL